jgi:hypothetical protein
MYAFFILLSVLTMAVGFFAVGFGLSPYELSLGNALIVAGAVAIVGGMLLFALASALRQLRRIADALGPRPAPAPRRQPMPEPAEAAPVQRPQPPAQRIPYPPRPGADQREVRFEPRGAPPPADVAETPPPVERPRPNIFGVARSSGDTPMVDEQEEVPLAPSRLPAPPPPVMRAAPPPAPEPPAEPRPTQADIMARLSNLAAAPPRPAPRPEPPRAPLPPPPPPAEQRPAAAEQRRPNMFDALWPADQRAPRQSQPETIARAPKPEARPEAKAEPRLEARPDLRVDVRPEPRSQPRSEASEPTAEPRFEPPMSRERIEPMVNGGTREPMMPPPAEPRPIAILKSGVIDGMAYTLYTDGSIEAELPQGTMRFASIEALRAHLEKTERQD